MWARPDPLMNDDGRAYPADPEEQIADFKEALSLLDRDAHRRPSSPRARYPLAAATLRSQLEVNSISSAAQLEVDKHSSAAQLEVNNSAPRRPPL